MSEERLESEGERRANIVTAALGLVAVFALIPFLLKAAGESGEAWAETSVLIYSASLLALYLSSTIYHSLPPGRARLIARVFDHSAIFVLIAGTYTPFALGLLIDERGWPLFLLEWAMAGIGIVFKIAGGMRYRHFSNLLYLGMGWLGVFWTGPFLHQIPLPGVFWIFAGGIVYTLGVPFYVAKVRPYAHSIWHLFVLGGTCCHAYAVLKYAF